MSTLKVDQVSKLYRSTSRDGALTPALRKVTFDLKQGEVISLIGESGSGKTTIGKVILRLVQPTARHGDLRRQGHRHVLSARAARVLPARAGGLPGPVQLLQPHLPGGPGLSS